jgi:hypothetical protein
MMSSDAPPSGETHEERKARIGLERASKKALQAARKRQKKERGA